MAKNMSKEEFDAAAKEFFNPAKSDKQVELDELKVKLFGAIVVIAVIVILWITA